MDETMMIDAALALAHLRGHEADQPVVGEDVVVEDLAELLVGDAGHGAVIGIARSIADEDVDRAEPHFGLGDEGLKARLVTDGRGDGDGALLPVALR